MPGNQPVGTTEEIIGESNNAGDQVTQGTLIALLGSTGHSTGPHVHFEIRDGDTAVNPRTVLPKSKVADLLDEDAPPAKIAHNR